MITKKKMANTSVYGPILTITNCILDAYIKIIGCLSERIKTYST